MLRILSLGAGVQSSTLLLMAAAGELEHVPDAAIFADTGWEPRAVYEWLDWLEEQVRGVIPIYRVSRGTDARGNGSIRDSYYIAQNTGKRYVQLPVFVKVPVTRMMLPDGRDLEDAVAEVRGWSEKTFQKIRDSVKAERRGAGVTIIDLHTGSHIFTRDLRARLATTLWEIRRLRRAAGQRVVGYTKGMARRQCTKEFKIEPITRKVRELVGLRPGQPGPRRIVAEQWMGISLDEAVRMKDSRIRWLQHRYPLIDLRWTRRDCLQWWESRGLPTPPKSACIGCPYTDDARWRHMKETAPAEFAEAVEFDRIIRHGGGRGTLRGENYLHSSLLPLDEVDFSTAEERGQGSLFDGFANECEGMCGV
jgi:hypothetical protein